MSYTSESEKSYVNVIINEKIPKAQTILRPKGVFGTNIPSSI